MSTSSSSSSSKEIKLVIKVDYPSHAPTITTVDTSKTLTTLLPSLATLLGGIEELARYACRGVTMGYDVMDLDGPNRVRPLSEFTLDTGSTIYFAAPIDLKPARKRREKEEAVGDVKVGSDEKFFGLNSSNIFTKIKGCKSPKQRKIMFEFVDRYWRDIVKNNKKEVMALPEATLIEILKSNSLMCKEIEIFNTVVAWGREEAKRKAAKLTTEEKKELKDENAQLKVALTNVLPHVRIPLLTATEMALQVTPLKLLAPEQELQMYSYIASVAAAAKKGGSSSSSKKDTSAKVAGFVTAPRKSLLTTFTFDPERKGTSIVLSGGNRIMTAQSGHTAGMVLGTVAMSSGINYWEVRVDRGRGGGHLYIGLAQAHTPLNSDLGATGSFGWYFDGSLSVPGSVATSPSGTFRHGVGDTVGLLLNCEKWTLSMYVNQRYTGHCNVTPSLTYYPAFGCYGAQDQYTLIEEPTMPDPITP